MSKQILFLCTVLIFSARIILAAEHPITTHDYVILSDSNTHERLNNLVTTNLAMLDQILGLDGKSSIINLESPNELKLINVGNEKPTVIIVTGKKTLEMFNIIESSDKLIHTIILIDPKVVKKSIAHPLGGPINIPYAKITNCIYNFYSEYQRGITRKIKSWYDEQGFLKGINIKCENIDKFGARLAVNFESLLSSSDIPITDSLGKMFDVIRLINERYHVENDLTCLLFSQNKTVRANANCPILYINKPVKIEQDMLWTHLYSSVAGDTYDIASDPLHPNTIKKINEQIEREKAFSTDMQAGKITERRGFIERQIKPEFWEQWNAINQGYMEKFQASNPPNPRVQATIRMSDDLCPQELQYFTKREKRVRACLEIEAKDYCPRIAVVASGGGVRAMLATLGALKGLEDIRFMDAITYLCGLSGSTWAIGSWLSSGLPISELSEIMVGQLDIGNMINPKDLAAKISNAPNTIAEIAAPYYYKKEQGLPYSMVDLYGGYLMHYLIPEPLQFTYLSQQAARINDGSMPLPIYTAVRGDGKTESQVASTNKWYEFTPYEIGASWLGKAAPGKSVPVGIHIPSWAFGRTFDNGESTNLVAEQPFCLHMATFGSAFALDVGRAYQEMKKAGGIMSWLATPLKLVHEDRQFTAATFKNFTYKLPISEISDQENMQMVDAGLAFNLPYPPISGEHQTRKADIIIFIDASAGEKGKALKKVKEYAREHNIPFPDLDIDEFDLVNLRPLQTANFDERIDISFRAFMSINRQAPLVIYIRFTPDTKDKQTKPDFAENCMRSTCNTFNFIYLKIIADQVITMMKNNIVLNEVQLKNAIYTYCQLKTNQDFYKTFSAASGGVRLVPTKPLEGLIRPDYAATNTQ